MKLLRKLLEREWLVWLVAIVFGGPLIVAVVVTILGLGGCASVFDLQWTKTAEPIATRFYVTAPNTDATCRSIGLKSPGSITACSKRDYKQGLCMIYLPPNAPDWLREHEEKHCDGYDHE